MKAILAEILKLERELTATQNLQYFRVVKRKEAEVFSSGTSVLTGKSYPLQTKTLKQVSDLDETSAYWYIQNGKNS